jgi:hypothetical protein
LHYAIAPYYAIALTPFSLVIFELSYADDAAIISTFRHAYAFG